jgi:predicted HTH domain antitoxin
MGTTVTTRISNELNNEITKISRIEKLDKSTVVRRLISESIEEWKKKYALSMYKKGLFSTEQAADFIGISLWRFSDLLKKSKTTVNYDIEEFERDLENIK